MTKLKRLTVAFAGLFYRAFLASIVDIVLLAFLIGTAILGWFTGKFLLVLAAQVLIGGFYLAMQAVTEHFACRSEEYEREHQTALAAILAQGVGQIAQEKATAKGLGDGADAPGSYCFIRDGDDRAS